jgi:hypothetical protein
MTRSPARSRSRPQLDLDFGKRRRLRLAERDRTVEDVRGHDRVGFAGEGSEVDDLERGAVPRDRLRDRPRVGGRIDGDLGVGVELRAPIRSTAPPPGREPSPR